MTDRTDKSAAEIIREAGGPEQFINPEYLRQAERAYQRRKAEQLGLPQPTPQRLLRNAIDGLERKGLPVAGILPEMLMLMHVMDFLNQPEVRAIQEAA
jgi:hypothetical protein